MTLPPGSQVGGNGVERYTDTSAFPDQSTRIPEYFVDAVFAPDP